MQYNVQDDSLQITVSTMTAAQLLQSCYWIVTVLRFCPVSALGINLAYSLFIALHKWILSIKLVSATMYGIMILLNTDT